MKRVSSTTWKRCPFCKGAPILEKLNGFMGAEYFQVKCNECGAKSDISGTSRRALENWNNRSEQWYSFLEEIPPDHQKILLYSNRKGIMITTWSAIKRPNKEGKMVPPESYNHWMYCPDAPQN